MSGWIGVDLDGTLAEYHGWIGSTDIGKPIPKMLERVKKELAAGTLMKIVTARVSWEDGDEERFKQAEAAGKAIVEWCKQYLGQELEVTNCKDYGMLELWDDRVKQVLPNEGVFLEDVYNGVLSAVIEQGLEIGRLKREIEELNKAIDELSDSIALEGY